jgi:hypothetical protein
MYGQEHLKEIDEAIIDLVEEKLKPFAELLHGLDAVKVDRDTAHFNELAERGVNAPRALALHFRYFAANPRSAELGGLAALLAVKDVEGRPLGQALAEIVESVPPQKIPAALLQARMILVTMAAGIKIE